MEPAKSPEVVEKQLENGEDKQAHARVTCRRIVDFETDTQQRKGEQSPRQRVSHVLPERFGKVERQLHARTAEEIGDFDIHQQERQDCSERVEEWRQIDL